MENLIRTPKSWIGRIGPAGICIAAICLIAAVSGYGVQISPAEGLEFAPVGAAETEPEISGWRTAPRSR